MAVGITLLRAAFILKSESNRREKDKANPQNGRAESKNATTSLS